jgi:biotin operon repressor
MSSLAEHKRDLILDAMGDGVTTADVLAKAAGCSERTVYRYIGMLRADGHKILSGPGYGYMLRRRAPAGEGHAHG